MGKILLVVLLFAALVYGFFWLMERRRGRQPSTGSTRSTGRPSGVPKRVVAPDDDEDFLRDLEQRRRRAAREQRGTDRRTPGPSAPGPQRPDGGDSGNKDASGHKEQGRGKRSEKDQDGQEHRADGDPDREGPADTNRSKPD